MTSWEASLLAKLKQIEHNQKKIMIGIIEISNTIQLDMEVDGEDGNEFILSDLIVQQWNNLDQELPEKKRLKAQWKKKLESDK